jgi:hypothetical protein
MCPSQQGSTTSAGSADLKVSINAVYQWYSASVMVPDVTAALLTTNVVDPMPLAASGCSSGDES